MDNKKSVFVIIGSASERSANEKLIDIVCRLTKDLFTMTTFKDLKTLPHFDPELSLDDAPRKIRAFRDNIENADGIIVCTPEYVFSIPSGLKNAIEWCVSTTVFSDKPIGIITASASGKKGHEELKMIMKTIGAKITEETALLISGIKAKIDNEGKIRDEQTQKELSQFIASYKKLLFEPL